MSDNAILAAMRRMGIAKDEMSGHGFRAMARTILDEVLGFRPDFIEHQLAHAGSRSEWTRLQPDGASGGAPENDAGLGGLPG
jgi:integrase